MFFVVLTVLAACLAWFDSSYSERRAGLSSVGFYHKEHKEHKESTVVPCLVSLLYVVQTVLVTVALLLAYSTPHLFVVASLYSFAALVGAFQWWRKHSWQHVLVRFLWALMPCVSLWVAYGMFWHETGGWRYDMPVVHVGLTSFVFWFVFLAALFGSGTRLYCYSQFPTLVVGVAWLYPLMRLYSIGVWNVGWHTVTVWSGLVIALWSALFPSTFRQEPVCTRESRWFVQVFIALAFAMVGFGSILSIAVGCSALLVALFLSFGLTTIQQYRALWFVSGVVPFSAPWMVFWMALSAISEQGHIVGVALLWLTALFFATGVVRLALRKVPQIPRLPRPSLGIALGSVLIGMLLPMCMMYIAHAVLLPLDGALVSTVSERLWPWSSLHLFFSASAPYQPIEVVASVALAVYMLLLSIAVWVLAGFMHALRSR